MLRVALPPDTAVELRSMMRTRFAEAELVEGAAAMVLAQMGARTISSTVMRFIDIQIPAPGDSNSDFPASPALLNEIAQGMARLY